jgi:hypothetical protein
MSRHLRHLVLAQRRLEVGDGVRSFLMGTVSPQVAGSRLARLMLVLAVWFELYL